MNRHSQRQTPCQRLGRSLKQLVSHFQSPESRFLAGSPQATGLSPGAPQGHIESCLAYSRDMPTLAIAHDGIDRGIFAHGAADVFVHQTDLSDVDWVHSENIQKALVEFRRRI